MKTLIIDRVHLFQEMIATILADTDIEQVFDIMVFDVVMPGLNGL